MNKLAVATMTPNVAATPPTHVAVRIDLVSSSEDLDALSNISASLLIASCGGDPGTCIWLCHHDIFQRNVSHFSSSDMLGHFSPRSLCD